MGTSIVIFSLLAVFLARDVQLLRAYAGGSVLKRLTIYAGSILIFTVTIAMLTRLPHPVKFQTLLRLPAVWMASLGVHLCALAASLFIKRMGRFRSVWWLAILPTPTLLLCLLSVPFATTAAIAALWILVVSFTILVLAHFGVETETGAALDYAAMSNCTVLALLPLGLPA